jgi:DNA-directed RNA polymerase subunit RPC12/RpoP
MSLKLDIGFDPIYGFVLKNDNFMYLLKTCILKQCSNIITTKFIDTYLITDDKLKKYWKTKVEPYGEDVVTTTKCKSFNCKKCKFNKVVISDAVKLPDKFIDWTNKPELFHCTDCAFDCSCIYEKNTMIALYKQNYIHIGNMTAHGLIDNDGNLLSELRGNELRGNELRGNELRGNEYALTKNFLKTQIPTHIGNGSKYFKKAAPVLWCICGKSHILVANLIQNIHTKQIYPVGNSCIDKIVGLSVYSESSMRQITPSVSMISNDNKPTVNKPIVNKPIVNKPTVKKPNVKPKYKKLCIASDKNVYKCIDCSITFKFINLDPHLDLDSHLRCQDCRFEYRLKSFC